MTGEELFKIQAKRDYSGSEDDSYAQWLQTLFLQLPSDQLTAFWELLEEANATNRKIRLKPSCLLRDEYRINSLFLD